MDELQEEAPPAPPAPPEVPEPEAPKAGRSLGFKVYRIPGVGFRVLETERERERERERASESETERARERARERESEREREPQEPGANRPRISIAASPEPHRGRCHAILGGRYLWLRELMVAMCILRIVVTNNLMPTDLHQHLDHLVVDFVVGNMSGVVVLGPYTNVKQPHPRPEISPTDPLEHALLGDPLGGEVQRKEEVRKREREREREREKETTSGGGGGDSKALRRRRRSRRKRLFRERERGRGRGAGAEAEQSREREGLGFRGSGYQRIWGLLLPGFRFAKSWELP